MKLLIKVEARFCLNADLAKEAGPGKLNWQKISRYLQFVMISRGWLP